jgi:acetylglutamate kinase
MSAPVVIKIGGALLEADLGSFWAGVAERAARQPVVVVHGGGPQSTAMARRLGHEPRMVQDTDLDIVRWVLRGELSLKLVTGACRAGLRAVGVSGADDRLVRVHRRPPWTVDGEQVDFGWVGDVDGVGAGLLDHLLAGGFTPVVSPMGVDASGQVYNVNADTIALEIASALGAEAFLLVTETGAVLDATGARCVSLDAGTVQSGVADGWIGGGMRVKVTVAREARDRGVGTVFIAGPDDVVACTSATAIL